MTPASTPADLRPLTALRFFAAAWVALYAFWPNLDVGFTPNLAAKGYLGVELFFILSGFILSHVYLEAHGTRRFSYRAFLWARVARIYPLHLATLAGVGLLALVALTLGMTIDDNILGWASLPANLGLVHAWGLAPKASWNHSSWSISAEWFAYLAFPAFALVAWRLKEWPVAAVVGAALLMIGLYAGFERLAGFSLTEATIRWGALRIVPCFALGCALYLAHRRSALRHGGAIALISTGVAALSASLLWWDAITVLAFGGLILGLASVPNARAGWLAARPAVYLGEISYSIYMILVPWQLLAVNLASRVTGAESNRLPFFVWLAVVAALPLAAALAYHGVEYPARRLMRGGWRRQAKAVDRDESAHLLA